MNTPSADATADPQGHVILGTDADGDSIFEDVLSEAVAAFSDGVNTGGAPLGSTMFANRRPGTETPKITVL